MTLEHTIRPAHLGDRGFIIDSWLTGYHESPQGKLIPDAMYWSAFGQKGLVEALVDLSPPTVACLPERPEFIYGWACAGQRTLHYLYVRADFRRQGIGAALYQAVGSPQRVTHVTTDGSRFLAKLGVKHSYVNPYREMR